MRWARLTNDWSGEAFRLRKESVVRVEPVNDEDRPHAKAAVDWKWNGGDYLNREYVRESVEEVLVEVGIV